ncbi:MAG: hypothetical protein Kow00105_12330 [Phycisphaeraceae bacterium]
MGRNNDSWGIEVGAYAIKAMHLVKTGSGAKASVRMADYEVLPFKQVLTTPDLNVDEAIQVNLDQLMARHDLSKSTVVVSVPGHKAFARFAKLPPVEPKKIPHIVEFEAKQQIPFPIEQVEWDYQVFQQEDSPDVEVGIFAITKERVMNYLSNYNAVNLRVDALTLSPIAVFNAFVYDTAEEPPESGVIYLDIGTTSTDVIIVEDGGIWLRTLPLGGNTFTEALVKAFKLSYHKAEKLKKEAATSKYARQIFQAMRPVFADLVQELQRSLGYYQSMNRDANLTKLVGVGSTFKLPGLQKFLKQQLDMEVVRPDGFKRISPPEDKAESKFSDKAINLATAYGLALQGLGLETVSANILPAHIIRQRMWKAKQPWIGAAAACFAAMAGVAVGTTMKTASAYEQQIDEVRALFTRVDREAAQFKQQFDQIDTTSDPRQRIENLRTILRSRDLWPLLLEDITRAAMALDPNGEQQVVFTNEYDEIAKIPREERRRVYIQSITSVYDPGGTEEATDESGMPGMDMMSPYGGMPGMDPYGGMGGEMGMDPYGGMGGYGASPYGGMGGYGGMPGMGGAGGELGATYTLADFFGEGKTPPHFIITVRGTTPNKEGSKFLENNFVGWLKKNADNPDRPYRFQIDTDVIRKFGKVVVPSTTEPGMIPGAVPGNEGLVPGGYNVPGTASPYGSSDMAAGMPPGGMGMDMYGAMPYGGMMGAGGPVDFLSLLPQRPLLEEDRSNDYQFEIQWKVFLRNPEGEPANTETDTIQDGFPTDEPAPASPEPGQTAAILKHEETERGAS